MTVNQTAVNAWIVRELERNPGIAGVLYGLPACRCAHLFWQHAYAAGRCELCECKELTP